MTPARHDIDVLICTIGEEGIRRVLSSRHPELLGVHYVVSWQLPLGDLPVPQELAGRDDFTVIKSPTRGISANRNIAMQWSDAEICLMGDDDVDYSAEGLQELRRYFRDYPDVDVAAVRFTCGGRFPKVYPREVTDLYRMPRGWYIGAVEIAYRTDSVRGKVRFNERISLSTEHIFCGEEDIFMEDARRAGLLRAFFPVTIGAHDHPSTGNRHASDPRFIFAHGAIMTYTHPRVWPLRTIVHALRARSFAYLWHEWRGARFALKTKILYPDERKSE